MPCMSRSQFLDQYNYEIDPEHDFMLNGERASWASGHPKEWGAENVSHKLPCNSLEDRSQSISSDVSSDGKLLAVSACDKILIYHIATRELRQTLNGCGRVHFRPVQTFGNDQYDSFVRFDDGQEKPKYMLLSKAPSMTRNLRRQAPDQLMLWDLDHNGKLLDEEEYLDVSSLAAKALNSITPDLENQHEWSEEFIASTTLKADFEAALGKAEQFRRTRSNTVFEYANTGSFGSTVFTNDGNKLLYVQSYRSTQNGMRDANELPQVVVWDIDAGKELFHLSGHTDSIMWVGCSSDSKHIASISWDGTMRMYDGQTGEFNWVTENSGGQSWAGAFSPDSSQIVWSSDRGMTIKIHDVATGVQLAIFPKRFKHWCRRLAWHPDGQSIALAVENRVHVWRPWVSSGEGSVTQDFSLATDGSILRGFVSFSDLVWVDDGSKLVVSSSEGTHLVWDSKTNSKEAFIRPKGLQVASNYQSSICLVKDDGNDFYISVDGDDCVRFWRTSVPAFPSWWEKEPPYQETTKYTYPATGKYVKVVKSISNDSREADSGSRDTWAAKGAELWAGE